MSAVASYHAENGAFPDDTNSLVLSEGTVIEAATSRDGASYCLRGWNPQANLTKDNPGYFDSASGADGLVES